MISSISGGIHPSWELWQSAEGMNGDRIQKTKRGSLLAGSIPVFLVASVASDSSKGVHFTKFAFFKKTETWISIILWYFQYRVVTSLINLGSFYFGIAQNNLFFKIRKINKHVGTLWAICRNINTLSKCNLRCSNNLDFVCICQLCNRIIIDWVQFQQITRSSSYTFSCEQGNIKWF